MGEESIEIRLSTGARGTGSTTKKVVVYLDHSHYYVSRSLSSLHSSVVNPRTVLTPYSTHELTQHPSSSTRQGYRFSHDDDQEIRYS